MVKYCISWNEGDDTDISSKLGVTLVTNAAEVHFPTHTSAIFTDTRNRDISAWENVLNPVFKGVRHYICKIAKDDNCHFIEALS